MQLRRPAAATTQGEASEAAGPEPGDEEDEEHEDWLQGYGRALFVVLLLCQNRIYIYIWGEGHALGEAPFHTPFAP